jgi:hypothetical protein
MTDPFGCEGKPMDSCPAVVDEEAAFGVGENGMRTIEALSKAYQLDRQSTFAIDRGSRMVDGGWWWCIGEGAW